MDGIIIFLVYRMTSNFIHPAALIKKFLILVIRIFKTMTKALFFVLILALSLKLNAQNISNDELVESHFTIESQPSKGTRYPNREWIKGIILKSIDASGEISWVSPLITTFSWIDYRSYSIKTKVPKNILSNSREVWCFVVQIEPQIVQDHIDTIKFGGGTLGRIELFLSSTPNNAMIYLIPNRIWLNDIQFSDWKKNTSIISDYSVDKSNTNTSVYIDEIVYTVIYKIGDKYSIKTHHTNPFVDEPKQYCSTQFP
jgi:hypothetical protein